MGFGPSLLLLWRRGSLLKNGEEGIQQNAGGLYVKHNQFVDHARSVDEEANFVDSRIILAQYKKAVEEESRSWTGRASSVVEVSLSSSWIVKFRFPRRCLKGGAAVRPRTSSCKKRHGTKQRLKKHNFNFDSAAMR